MPPPKQVKEDLAKLQELASSPTAAEILGVIHREVLDVANKVTNWKPVEPRKEFLNVQTGYVQMFYKEQNEESEVLRYTVLYVRNNIGNLVHELTHVAVNEAYRSELVNYPKHKRTRVPARFSDETKRGGYSLVNEAQRQESWSDEDKNRTLIDTLKELDTLATKVKAIEESTNISVVSNQLKYGSDQPHKEYDTVINQILVWLHQWGYNKKEEVSAEKNLYVEVERCALKAYECRKEARQASSSHTPHTPSVSSSSGDRYTAATSFPKDFAKETAT